MESGNVKIQEIIEAYQSKKVSRSDILRILEKLKGNQTTNYHVCQEASGLEENKNNNKDVDDVDKKLENDRERENDLLNIFSGTKPNNVNLIDLKKTLPHYSNNTISTKPNAINLSQVTTSIDFNIDNKHAASLCNIDVELTRYNDGVYAIDLIEHDSSHSSGAISWSDRLIHDLQEAFQYLNEISDVKTVLLRGSVTDYFPIGASKEEQEKVFSSKLPLLPLQCNVPVIAVIKGNAKGIGYLIAALCDFIVCSEGSDNCYFQSITGLEKSLLDGRFGSSAISDSFDNHSEHRAGFNHVAKLPVSELPADEIDSYAFELAAEIIDAPREAAILLKKHLSEQLRQYAEQMLSERLNQSTFTKEVKQNNLKYDWPASVLKSIDQSCNCTLDGEPESIYVGTNTATMYLYPNGIVKIILNDIDSKNTFTDAFIDGVTKAFEKIKEDKRCKVAILTGNGKYFACGGTKQNLLSIQSGKAKFTDINVYTLPLECPIPVISAMQGHAIGAGWSMGMYGDFVIYSETHVYQSPYMKYGFTPGAGSTFVFPSKIGYDLARDILFTAKAYTGKELKNKGMCLPVMPADEVMQLAACIASELAAYSRQELEDTKQKYAKNYIKYALETIKSEQSMHEICFLHNKDVLKRINENFDYLDQTDEETESETDTLNEYESLANDRSNIEVIKNHIKKSLASELFIDESQIDGNAKFTDIGLDSITGVKWIKTINTDFNLNINATKIYSHPTLDEFTKFVHAGYLKGNIQNHNVKVINHSKQKQMIDTENNAVKDDRFTIVSVKTIRSERHISKMNESTDDAVSMTDVSGNSDTESSIYSKSKIAVIGMSGQFPKARTLNKFWNNLINGRECISEIPSARWDTAKYYDPNPDTPGKSYSKWMGILDDVSHFDPLFFNISPREAEWMDPQHRLFLQNAWHCIEDAGYNSEALSGSKCGVFAGCATSEYIKEIKRDDLNSQNFMGNSTSILASKISYTLNLQGPCVSIDTACSSSLVALSSACDSLVLGTSDTAIAGGVYVMSGPDMHIMTSKAGMLSADGRCYTFDQRANGFVPGEGVGVVFLKRLDDAVKDNDHIYGVLSGWGINQDGKTNGITAPNPESQTRLQNDIYDQFSINPESIQLIEAHGTGTKLGDPIEVEGLKGSFGAYTSGIKYCALGSVKSNIGHLLAAAGIAGTIKLLLSLKNKKIPPTINYQGLNEHIELDNSPFYINSTCKDWDVPKGHKRRGAVSSFGFSGTNAHVVLEEYISTTNDVRDNEPQIKLYAAILSARSEKQLKEYAKKTSDYLRSPDICNELNIADIIFTLQVGRDPMNHRWAAVIRSTEELINNLDLFVLGKNSNNYKQGSVNDGDKAISIITENSNSQDVIERFKDPGQLDDMLKLWVNGLEFDWWKQYNNTQDTPKRVSLPGYPFEQKSYWIYMDEEPGYMAKENIDIRQTDYLNPLLHGNSTELYSDQQYTSMFTGNEFFFSHHIIKGHRVLPGVCHLEMARAAIEDACGGRFDTSYMQIKNIVWLRPIVGPDKDKKEPLAVHIALTEEEGGGISYKIFSGDQHNFATHSQGIAILGGTATNINHDIKELLTECSDVGMKSSKYFERMKEKGADLGPGFRGIQKFYIGSSSDGSSQVLTHIKIPDTLSERPEEFRLHPTPMDSAVHTFPALLTETGDFTRTPLALPFALNEMEFLKDCNDKEMWALARRSDEGERGGQVSKYDLDIYDNSGDICVRFKGFSVRSVDQVETVENRSSTVIKEDNSNEIGNLLLTPNWIKELRGSKSKSSIEYDHIVILCGIDDMVKIQACLDNVKVMSVTSQTEESIENSVDITFLHYAKSTFHIVKQLLQRKISGEFENHPLHIQIVVNEPYLSGLIGLIKTLQLESPQLVGQLIEVESGDGGKSIANKIHESYLSPGTQHIRYINGEREVSTWKLDDSDIKHVPIPWRENGVYLITGGAGELGTIFAKEILKQTGSTSIILTGRSPFNEQIEARVDSLKTNASHGLNNNTVVYKQLDVCDRASVDLLVTSIINIYGRLDGVLHGAGVIEDNFIINKSDIELDRVLSPKVSGVVNLDMATRGIDIDFFVLFSSIASAIGNAGQADYAMANAFLDSYAWYRNGHRELNGKNRRSLQTIKTDNILPPFGKTISINWPLWSEGGMDIDKQTASWMRQNMGLVKLETTTAIDSFYASLATDKSQIMVVEGEIAVIKEQLLAENKNTVVISNSVSSTQNRDSHYDVPDSSGLQNAVLDELKPQVAKILKISSEEIDIDKELNTYGFDSITLTELTNNLNKQYKIPPNHALNPTLFFEHTTLRSFSKYLAEESNEIRSKIISLEKTQPNRDQSTGVSASAIVSDLNSDSSKGHSKTPPKQSGFRNTQNEMSKDIGNHLRGNESNQSMDIAVVGLSGRFPMASNVQEYWQNLYDGRDCISEIPNDRWDWKSIYGDPTGGDNKTDIKWGGFIDGVTEFDPLFFGISPREALYMDPMQRLLMQHIWLALEDAGYSARSISGSRTGIFVGTSVSEYGTMLSDANIPNDAFTPTGRSSSLCANRMSYFLNITGPSETVDTACSSSLVAIHRAVLAIRGGQCDMALVGGVNTLLTPDGHIAFRKAGMLATDGRCKTFSKQANGYTRGEGVGILYLKKLGDAEASGDHIYGVIKATGENHGGRSNSLTAPNPKAQADLIKNVYLQSGIDPRTISYVEAHGTGTELGDPVEVNGLKSAFKDLYQATGDYKDVKQHCGLGSVKSNIGHLELAAGAAGAIKVLLQLKNKTLAKTLHCDEINPYIHLDNTPFYIVQETKDWLPLTDSRGIQIPRRAGVSSFGFGGANAHVLFEEYIENNPTSSNGHSDDLLNRQFDDVHLIVMSAKSKSRLKEMVERFLNAISEESAYKGNNYSDHDLENMAYTLQVGREPLEERVGVSVKTLKELQEKLGRFLSGEDLTDIYCGSSREVNKELSILTDDDDIQEAIQNWIPRKKYKKLLRLWVSGYDIDWDELYIGNGNRQNRISLPTYPFARESYSPGSSQFKNQFSINSHNNDKQNIVSDVIDRNICLLKKDWIEKSLPASISESMSKIARPFDGTVIIFANEETKSLAARMVSYVPNSEIINMSDLVQSNVQILKLLDSVDTFAGCIDIIGCGTEVDIKIDWIKHLQQLISSRKKHKNRLLTLLCVTKGLESLSNQSTNLAGSLHAGLYRMLQSEYTKIRSRHMDTDLSIDETALAKQIATEWLLDNEESEVCYRSDQRYVSILKEQPHVVGKSSLKYPEDHVLLITGGTRGIGLLCAQHFVRNHGVKKLVLTGREVLPHRKEWEELQITDQLGGDSISQKINDIKELENLGAEVITLSLMLNNENDVRASIDMINQTTGKIGGLIHCAGLNDINNPAFIKKSLHGISQVMQPKVEGAGVLLKCLDLEQLQFFVMFSSVTSAIPSLASGQSDYAMSNAYMDYLAEANSTKYPIVSIQWPSWKETGMGEATTRAYSDTGLHTITNDEGLLLLDYVLYNRPGPVVLPAVVNPNIWKPNQLLIRNFDNQSSVTKTTSQGSGLVSVSTISNADMNEIRSATLDWLKDLFSKELMIDESSLDLTVAFADYGVDSIMLTQLLRRIDEYIYSDGSGSIDPSIFFEYPTLDTFATWLIKSHHDQLVNIFNKTVNVCESNLHSEHKQNMPSNYQIDEDTDRDLEELSKEHNDIDSCNANMKYSISDSDIAVIGLSCQFSGADNIDEFWELLSEGRSSIRKVPSDRWGHSTSEYAGLISNITHFDPSFFMISDNDAKAMDPQSLLLLEESLKTIYHAGYNLDDVKGQPIGVFIGARSNNQLSKDTLSNTTNPILAVGQNYLAANISQFFDLQGPSMVSDTACSSALVNMHVATQYLVSGEITTALVGGVSLLQNDAAHHLFKKRNILSSDSSFHLFDNRSNGVVLGEGVGVVLLKKLDKAIADGDQICAVIKGISINNDGRTAGPASPNLQAQKSVMQLALQKSGIKPDQVNCIELNGSGSEVTDLLELKAVESVYRPSYDSTVNSTPCEIGSMEPNIGHPLCAKGIASFIKSVLMLKHRQKVPFLSGQEPMTHYDMDSSPFYFQRESINTEDDSRLIGINCFADGGTNAHVILESWDERIPRVIARRSLQPPELNKRNVYKAQEKSILDKAWPFDIAKDPARFLLTIHHPIVKNHKAYGQEILPGLAYIDILFQYFKIQGYTFSELELRNLSIYYPLVVGSDYSVILQIRCSEDADGIWKISFEGREKDANGILSDMKRYAVAEMCRIDPIVFDELIDIKEVKKMSDERHDLDELYAQCRRQSLSHDGLIKATGEVFDNKEATYIDISVGYDALVTAGEYMFHPALIDGSSVGAQRLFASLFKGENRLILPLFYGSFRACSLINDACFTRIKTSSLKRKKELLYMDMEFFNESGIKVAELSNYACKVVRDEGSINPSKKNETRDDIRKPEKQKVSVVHNFEKESDVQSIGDYNIGLSDTSGAETYLTQLLAECLNISKEQIDTQIGYYELGLDSARLLEIVSTLEEKVGESLAPTLLFEYTTIEELGEYLTNKYPLKWNSISNHTNGNNDISNPTASDKKTKITHSDSLQIESPIDNPTSDIAIIGVAGRYPGSNTIDELWSNLTAGNDLVSEIPESRWTSTRLQGIKSPSGKSMSRWGGFIQNPASFDANFFRISPWEASLLDPQQRHFLEVCWETIEDAGYTPDNITPPRGDNKRRDVGVFVGVMHNDYAMLASDAIAQGQEIPISLNYAQIANRVSYFCNFHGPSLAVDTVCSSSLIAVHLAVQSIRNGESAVALAGGVNLSVHPNKYLTYGLMDMHSSDGRCRAFGKDGDGYVSGEGIGAVLLKPLERAIKDHDQIYAVIKGSVTNHVGSVSGLTVPSPVAQADMIEVCLDKSGINPRTISYLEAHGTGTSLGDPIELQGLVKAFSKSTSDKQFCAIGSVKSNIGHAESAAGISGLTKLLLQFKYKTLVPSLHSSEVNQYLDFKNSPFFIQQSTEEWKRPKFIRNDTETEIPRRAALSSFGASGSNAHIILEEYIPKIDNTTTVTDMPESTSWVIPISAKKEFQLKEYCNKFCEFLRNSGSEIRVSDLAYTLQVGRVAMEERIAFTAANIEEVVYKLEIYISDGISSAHENDLFYRGTVKRPKKSSQSTINKNKTNNIKKTVGNELLDKIASDWVKGISIEWDALREHNNVSNYPYKLSVPTYPFAKENYWIDMPNISDLDIPNTVLNNHAEHDTVYFTSRWKQNVPQTQNDIKQNSVTLFVSTDNKSNIVEKIEQLKLADRIDKLEVDEDISVQLQKNILQLFRYCNDPQQLTHTTPQLLIIYVPYDGNDLRYRALMGALRTIQLEFKHIKTKLIFDTALQANSIGEIEKTLRDEVSIDDQYTEIIIDNKRSRHVITHDILDSTKYEAFFDQEKRNPFRQRGVYLITGGLGGLGVLFAQLIGNKTDARIILIGRSRLSQEKSNKLSALKAEGINVEYHSCDTSSRIDVNKLIDLLVLRYGEINGIIHSAGVVSDNYILKKQETEIIDVLNAKVPSIINLDIATKDISLDFFVSFSSMASLGNPGQFDYATANAFLDVFASYREGLVKLGKRNGKSLSINWPLWKDGGMSVDSAYEEYMYDNFGIVPLTEEFGIKGFMDALHLPEPQLGIMHGDRDKIHKLLSHYKKRDSDPHGSINQNINTQKTTLTADKAKLIDGVVLTAIASTLAMKEEDIDSNTEFVEYGMDSISATKIANYINKHLDIDYTGALFLELNTADKIISHLRESINENNDNSFESKKHDRIEAVIRDHSTSGKTDGNNRIYEKVAIIGVDARLPGARCVEEYWDNITHKNISTKQVPASEWERRGTIANYDVEEELSSMQYAGLLDDIDMFDNEFWGITLADAKEMDPQQRLLLQSIWHCVESAGYSLDELTKSKVGLFLALDSLDYGTALRNLKHTSGSGSGITAGIIANQISYFCDFRGPSEVIDNACASTYVALRRAEQAIINGECDTAIVGAAKILLDPLGFLDRQHGEILTTSNRMYPFDARSNGYIRGEGVGCILLKSLSNAERDHDYVHAVVLGTGVSHNGSKVLSMSAPSVDGQYQAMQEALDKSNISPQTLDYVEAHGTANDFSDAAEIAAIKRVLKDNMDDDEYRNHRCAISSVKGNIGHLEGASGIASLIKALCSLRHKIIAPIATLSEIHPSIIASNSPIYFPTKLTEWKCDSISTENNVDKSVTPRRLGLHSVGIGGVNAHVILEEHSGYKQQVNSKKTAVSEDRGDYELFVISAKSKSALITYCDEWRRYISAIVKTNLNGEMALEDLAYTSIVSREAMPYRASYICNSIESLLSALKLGIEGNDENDSNITFSGNNIESPVVSNNDEAINISEVHSLSDLKTAANKWLVCADVKWSPNSDVRMRRIHNIPKYPFQNNKIWYGDDSSLFEKLYNEYFTQDKNQQLFN